MDKINQRVVEVIEQSGLSKSEFAMKVGVSPAIISHISSGRNKVGLELVQRILEHYTDISALWLLLGAGKMREDSTNNQILLLENQIDALKDELSSLVNGVNVFKRNFDKLNDLMT